MRERQQKRWNISRVREVDEEEEEEEDRGKVLSEFSRDARVADKPSYWYVQKY